MTTRRPPSANQPGACVVVMADEDKVKMDDEIRGRFASIRERIREAAS